MRVSFENSAFFCFIVRQVFEHFFPEVLALAAVGFAGLVELVAFLVGHCTISRNLLLQMKLLEVFSMTISSCVLCVLQNPYSCNPSFDLVMAV